MTHANRRLMELAVKNAQRIASEQFIAGLSGKLVGRFQLVEVIFYPELSSLLAPVLNRANREQSQKGATSSEVHLSVSSSWATGWKHFQSWTGRLPIGDYVLVIGGGNGQTFNGTVSWVSSLPGYVVPSSETLEMLMQMPTLMGRQLLVSSRDGNHAVVLEAYSGFLEEEPSPQEVVYETTAWGLD